MRFCFLVTLSLLSTSLLYAQKGVVRGNVYDKQDGEPIAFANVVINGTSLGDNTDFDGFFSIANVPAGPVELVITYLGYDTLRVPLEVKDGGIVYQRLYLQTQVINLNTVDVSGRRERARTEIQAATVTVTPQEIKALPATGGESDLAQYLTVLPGVVISGDQGGQLYIRGGAPVQNKILLDGLTIYNPFHSIGLFSVFETEAIQSVDLLTAGFNAEYGGRISAVVDVKTRTGNKRRFSGLVSASPFQAKALFEGPLAPLADDGKGGSISFLLTGKHSYLDQSSRLFYDYARDTNFLSFVPDSLRREVVLPYNYTDLYGKVTFDGGNGSQFNLFGFHFSDQVNFDNFLTTDWTTLGAGTNFTLIPPNSNVVIDGTVAYSDYTIDLREPDGRPRSSRIASYTAGLNFSYFGDRNQLHYGFEFHGFNTDLSFTNVFDIPFSQRDFTTELSGYLKYRQTLGRLIVEPGLRLHFYASQPKLSIEPRLGLKYAILEGLRLKLAGGLYSQNLVSTVNELDIVNFFVGFLAGPQETIFEPGARNPVSNRLQRSVHAVGGLELDLGDRTELNLEGYYKDFTQLIVVNREKRSGADPNFATETGEAYGADLSVRYESPKVYLWLSYSLAFVNRFDGRQDYPAVFDRRHNVNLLASYTFGQNRSWELSARWNLGAGFPFSRTQGFYQAIPFGDDKLLTDVLTGNYDLGVLLSDQRNDGRLPYYHRLDLSMKKTIRFTRYRHLDLLLSVTNSYNRDNVFFVDRLTNRTVRQLPLLPALSVTFAF